MFLTMSTVAQASPGANMGSKLATVVDKAKSVVVAHAQSVTSTTKDSMAYVRVVCCEPRRLSRVEACAREAWINV